MFIELGNYVLIKQLTYNFNQTHFLVQPWSFCWQFHSCSGCLSMEISSLILSFPAKTLYPSFSFNMFHEFLTILLLQVVMFCLLPFLAPLSLNSSPSLAV